MPGKEGDPTRGRELFTEKGCLACHAHEGTVKPLQSKEGKTLVGAVESEANFGPELSRIADKLAPETGRLWLVQWLMNPNVYHPRTRMPVTHLSPEQANDIAAWLLSQKTGWKDFLQAHWEQLAAADFFTVEVLTWRGLVRHHVFFVMELCTRRVHVAGISPDPSGAWLVQLARNLTDPVDGFLRGARHLILDRDPLYSQAFLDLLRSAGVEPVRCPPRRSAGW